MAHFWRAHYTSGSRLRESSVPVLVQGSELSTGSIHANHNAELHAVEAAFVTLGGSG